MPWRTRSPGSGPPVADSAEAAREAALRLLKARDRTPRDLARRLRDKGFEPGVVDAVVARLEEAGLLDEAATAERLVRAELRKAPAADRLLRSKLAAAGVGAEISERVIADALREVDLRDEAESLARRWLERHRGVDPATATRRLVGRLSRRGFGGETIREAVDRAMRGLHPHDG
jgi:regulatory protein